MIGYMFSDDMLFVLHSTDLNLWLNDSRQKRTSERQKVEKTSCKALVAIVTASRVSWFASLFLFLYCFEHRSQKHLTSVNEAQYQTEELWEI